MTQREKAEMYAKKRMFVSVLGEAYALDGTVKQITYTNPHSNLELVHIEYPGGHVDRINVTGNSHQAIGREIANQISGINAVGLIR